MLVNKLHCIPSCAEPLVMDNGKDLIEMVIYNYETPDKDVTEEDSGHDYSTAPTAVAAPP